MVMDKVGLNISALNDISPPNISIGSSAEEIAGNMVTYANTITYNYYGLGVMVTLFFFLVWKLGKGTREINEQFGSIRSVGVSAGVVGMIGVQALSSGIFTEYFHAVIFLGITMVCWVVIFIGEKR